MRLASEASLTPPPLLYCCTCKTLKAPTNFSPCEATGKGRCRECLRQRRKACRDANAVEMTRRAAEYYQANKERIKERDRRRRTERADEISARTKELRSLNLEHVRERGRVWLEKNKDRLRPLRKAYMKRYFEEDPRRRLLKPACDRARRKGVEFSISLDDIVIPDVCPLIGIRLVPGKGRQHAASPSLDRIDNRKGYVPGNVWVISHKANSAKNILTKDELISFSRAMLVLLQDGG